MIKLNLELMNKCEHASARRDKFRPQLDSICVCDNGRTRHYVATNAQIMVICTEKIPDGENTLQEEYGTDYLTLLEYRQQKLGKNDDPRFKLELNGEKYTIGATVGLISDKPYPNWKAVVPQKVEPITTWRIINPAFLVKLEKVFGGLTPLESPMGKDNDILAPIVFEQGDTKMVIMPMRPSNYHK